MLNKSLVDLVPIETEIYSEEVSVERFIIGMQIRSRPEETLHMAPYMFGMFANVAAVCLTLSTQVLTTQLPSSTFQIGGPITSLQLQEERDQTAMG